MMPLKSRMNTVPSEESTPKIAVWKETNKLFAAIRVAMPPGWPALYTAMGSPLVMFCSVMRT